MKGKIKVSLSTALLFIAIIVIIGLCFYIYIDKSNSNKEIEKYNSLFLRSMEYLNTMSTEGRYPDTFYAKIEEITNEESIDDLKVIKVKGLDINEANYREKFNIKISLTNVGNGIKIQHNENDISFEELKVGQTIAVYDYSHNDNSSDSNDLISVFKIVVLDDKL